MERRTEDIRRIEATFKALCDEKDSKYKELFARYETEKQ